MIRLLLLCAALSLAGCVSNPTLDEVPVRKPATESSPPNPIPSTRPVAVPLTQTSVPLKPIEPAATADLSVTAVALPDDVWERLRKGFAMPDLDNALVRQHEQWYASRPEYIERMTDRANRYLYYIVEEVQARQMPLELALLPFIESAFNPEALSSAKASGMWQFMPRTGTQFDLQQNAFATTAWM